MEKTIDNVAEIFKKARKKIAPCWWDEIGARGPHRSGTRGPSTSVPDFELGVVGTYHSGKSRAFIDPSHRLETSLYRFNTASDGRMVIFLKTDRDS